jgi:hypothetical protein
MWHCKQQAYKAMCTELLNGDVAFQQQHWLEYLLHNVTMLHLDGLPVLRRQVGPLCYPLLHLCYDWVFTSPGRCRQRHMLCSEL